MWLALRYRRIMQEVRQHYPGRHTVLITECGMTQGVVGGQDVGPWHAPTVPPDKVREVVQDSGVEVEPRVSEDDYWRSLVWYNGELLKDDYVQAALLFVVGAISPWDSFEHLGGMVDRLAAFEPQAPAQPVQPPAPAEPVQPPTPAEPVQPPTPIEPIQPPTPPEPDRPPTPGPSLGEALWAAGARARVIAFNRRAALQRRIFADGFVPTSPEFEVEHGGIRYVAQQAEHLDSGAVRVYYVKKGDWDNVARLRRDEGGQFWAV